LAPFVPEPAPAFAPYVLLFCLAAVASGGLDGDALFDVLPLAAPLGEVDF